MSRPSRTQSRRALHPAAPGLGERLRQLRVSAGMTQTELAGERFSKEYVSQIERGKTRPTAATLEWLASRLGIDSGFLAKGISADERDRVETRLARAEALGESEQFEEASQAYDDLRSAILTTGQPSLEVRALSGEAKILARQGEVRRAIELLLRARDLVEGSNFAEIERADVLYRLGVCRYMLSSIPTAVGLLTQALELAERSGMPCDQLRSDILHWRSRCYRRQRDYEAAREDVASALELAEALSDRRALGQLYFQASLLAERDGHWILARSYAERAKAQYEEVADRANVGKLLNNLGGLQFLLGNPPEAIRHLKDAFAIALDVGDDSDAAQTISSLAQIHLRTGEPGIAEDQARHALRLFADREEHIEGIGGALLVLGRALLEQDRLDEAEATLREAEANFDRLASASHRASAWLARGDLAARRNDDRAAARLYRSAAEALQDVRF